jgi:hypothetical protein
MAILPGSAPFTSVAEKQVYKLRFLAFYHPQLCEFIRALNRYGVPGLLTPENQSLVGPPVPDGQGSPYDPDPDNVETPWPDLVVDFDPGGAYSLYNWELFLHVPMLISDRLRQEQRFEEARRWLHYIFDPTTDEAGATPERFWRVRPLRDNDALDSAHELMELLSYTGTDPDLLARRRWVEDQVAEWLDHPFEPHRIARLRLVGYQKAVVMRYLDILLDWGDTLFRRDTIESITEAIQLYVLAAGILRARPQRVPARSTVAPKTYADLRQHLNDFSNAAVAMENEVVFPFATTRARHCTSAPRTTTSCCGTGTTSRIGFSRSATASTSRVWRAASPCSSRRWTPPSWCGPLRPGSIWTACSATRTPPAPATGSATCWPRHGSCWPRSGHWAGSCSPRWRRRMPSTCPGCWPATSWPC